MPTIIATALSRNSFLNYYFTDYKIFPVKTRTLLLNERLKLFQCDV